MSREALESALASMLGGHGPSAVEVAPASRRRFSVRLARVDGEDALDAWIPARGKGDRAALLGVGWERISESPGTPYYRRRVATAPEAVEAILAAYATTYGDIGDGAGWSLTAPGGAAAGSAAGASGASVQSLVATMVVVAAGALTWLVLQVESRPRSLPVVAAAFIAAAAALVVAFLAAGVVSGRLAARRSAVSATPGGRGIWSYAPTTLALIAAAAAAGIVLRVLPD